MAKSAAKAPKPPKADKVGKDAGGAAPAGGKPASGLFGLILLAVAAGASAFGVSYFVRPPAAPEAVACAAPAEGGPPVEPLASAAQAYVELPEVLTTIGAAPASRYIKIKVSIITEAGEEEAVRHAEAVLKDAFVAYLRSVDVRDFEDPSFYGHLRDQLARRAEIVLGQGTSKGVLVTEFMLR